MRPRLLLWGALLGLLGCTGSPPPTSTPAPPNKDANLIVELQGQVGLKRQGWTEYAPAVFGTAVGRGDLLRLQEPSRVRVMCADLTLAAVPSGIGPAPCKGDSPGVISVSEGKVSRTRSAPNGEFPVVIAPRKTKLLNPQPTIRWTPVAGATTYVVRVLRGSDKLWEKQVSSATRVNYQDAPPLAPGTSYKVVVAAGSRSSEQDDQTGLGFEMLQLEAAQRVREAEARIRGSRLDDPPTKFVIARMYHGRELNAEAMQLLEPLADSSSEPNVVRALGDVYLTVGLNRLAEERYLRSLGLSEQANDLEGQALDQRKLGDIYGALGNRTEAAERYRRALELYQQLGDTTTAKQIQDAQSAL